MLASFLRPKHFLLQLFEVYEIEYSNIYISTNISLKKQGENVNLYLPIKIL